MRSSFRGSVAAFLVVCTLCVRGAQALVGASGNTSQLGVTTNHNISGGGGSGTFSITESVVLDENAGPWTKNLINSSGGGISSGADRTIIETLTNVGATPWLDWHESVVSRTTINNPNDSVGFLFRDNSLSLMADYGGGFIPLTEAVDYTLVVTENTGPGGPGNVGNWETIDIFFAPHAVIQTGDILEIRKDIFEVLGDADPWRPDEAAVISQFPSPEPGSLLTCAVAVAALLKRRRECINITQANS
jgi:hypothetical protein